MITALDLANLGINPEEYNNLSEAEKQSVNDILQEMAQGNNNQYNELFYADYEEIPVDYYTFLTDDQYLGKSTKQGTRIYDFWKKEGQKIFNIQNAVEVALSGAIGTGKTTNGCAMMAYHMYTTMCLRNPQEFFSMRTGSKIAYVFLNNTLDSSSGVGYDTFQSFLMNSPWFLKHGAVAGRTDETRHYVPSGGFEILIGSRVQHTLGHNCLTGDTLILTDSGFERIDTLIGKAFRVMSYNLNSELVYSNICTAKITNIVSTLIEIELEDGTLLKCTPDHRFLLKSGEYKEAQHLTLEDELEDINLG